MQIPLIEPKSTRYIHVNPVTNHVHLLVPFVGGQDVSTDNTCRSQTELNAFFDGGAVCELEAYKSVLEFHISLLEEGDERRNTKKERLDQINIYLKAVNDMRNSYLATVKTFLAKPSNLYSIQLRPQVQDPVSNVVNPVFTVNRNNDDSGNPSSPLYNKMHEIFPGLAVGKPAPRTQLITAVLTALPNNASFEDIQRVLTEQCQILFGIHVDFQRNLNQTVDKAYIDELMGFGDETSEEYVKALLGLCAPTLSNAFTGSPFYFGTYNTIADKTEHFSIMTQFYLGVMNVHCRAKDISNKNFGEILDGSPALSQALVDILSKALVCGEDVEGTVVNFLNAHKQAFNLSRDLSPTDKDTIQRKFEITYRTVTGTKENPHMDDFMLLDTEACSEKDVFFTQKGLICTDFSNIATTGPHQAYFSEIREEASTHPEVMRPQDEPVITVDIEPEALMDKLGDVQWDRLPKEVADACRASPAFQLRQFPDDVAKGKQDEAEAILKASDDKQTLLTTRAKFTDYSGRTFHCTAYEYAYWAKDTHMCRMLESHMDDETKTQLLERVNKMEHTGLAYQQHGVSYQNPHYDMSFVLKNLSADEFRRLQTMVGQNSEKIQGATAGNYKTIPFTATEYEKLKNELFVHEQYGLVVKLKFDFKSLITALDTYVRSTSWVGHLQHEAWLNVGKAQREVPAHIAHEYCRGDRTFNPRPEFNEETLPRSLTFHNAVTNVKSWFPLTSSSSGLGFDFILARGLCRTPSDPVFARFSSNSDNRSERVDLEAVSHLDEVRTDDLTRSRENLLLRQFPDDVAKDKQDKASDDDDKQTLLTNLGPPIGGEANNQSTSIVAAINKMSEEEMVRRNLLASHPIAPIQSSSKYYNPFDHVSLPKHFFGLFCSNSDHNAYFSATKTPQPSIKQLQSSAQRLQDIQHDLKDRVVPSPDTVLVHTEHHLEVPRTLDDVQESIAEVIDELALSLRTLYQPKESKDRKTVQVVQNKTIIMEASPKTLAVYKPLLQAYMDINQKAELFLHALGIPPTHGKEKIDVKGGTKDLRKAIRAQFKSLKEKEPFISDSNHKPFTSKH